MIIGSVGALICNGLLAALWLFGDPTTMTSNPETGALNGVTSSLTLHIGLSVFTAGFQGLSGNIVIPMTADCADYEVYRTGRYVPGLMGTLFSFVDKIILLRTHGRWRDVHHLRLCSTTTPSWAT